MAGALILETSVLIDLERERARGVPGGAHEVLGHHADHHLYITATIAGEIAAGASMERQDHWRTFLAMFPWLTIDEAAAWHYGRSARYLRRTGQLIGANDLWIAAVGLANDVPVVTRNGAEFGRVPDLRVVAYE